jgi:hypothetical protein
MAFPGRPLALQDTPQGLPRASCIRGWNLPMPALIGKISLHFANHSPGFVPSFHFPLPAMSIAIPVLRNNTHSVAVGYLCWIFGFFGAHRFYYGRLK